MATAYAPGLTVSPDQVVLKRRRLPVAGQVLVERGQWVSHDTVVARAELPGDLETVRLAERMQMEPDELRGKLKVKVGDRVERGCLLAESAGLFGLFRSEVRSPLSGTVEYIAEATGHLGIRRPPSPIEVTAYVSGRVEEVEASQGVVIRTRGALIQGIFGVGGERQGEIRMAVDSPDDGDLRVDALQGSLAGKVLVGGACLSVDTLRRVGEMGAAGVVVGGIRDEDLTAYLGEEIGVAVTGDEDVPATLVVTEGFGSIRMARRTFELLRRLEGRFASLHGATQIRAGAVRPEILVPHVAREEGEAAAAETPGRPAAKILAPGIRVRAVRQPYFGELGMVTEMPPQPVRVASGAVVRILKMKTPDGREFVLPRANVEILES
ncbi:MAG: hypothetical protein HYU36_09850 [Planctomycetes bacterium]|nr:hypothetical protein [Planctomycetota bacterium]